MKRIALFLVLIVLTALVTGCKPGGDTSQQESADSSGSGGITETVADMVSKIDALYRYDVDRTLYESYPVSVGAGYSMSREPSGSRPDAGGQLTDGSFCTSHTSEAEVSKYIGFVGRDELVITLDLGEVKTELFDFSIMMLSSSLKSSSLPRYVVFSVSDDGESYIDIGKIYRDADVADGANYKFLLQLQKGISARYVRMSVPKDAIVGVWLYVDEFQVYSYREAEEKGESEPYYVNTELGFGEEARYWDSSDSDFDTHQNMLLNAPYTIDSVLILPESVCTDYYNSQPSAGQLTDGKLGGGNWSDSAYAHFTNGTGREIVFDIGYISSVDSFLISFYRLESYAIYLPPHAYLYASEDGEGWQRIAKISISGMNDGRQSFECDFDPVRARFLMVTIETPSHVWCDEIQVFGKKNTAGAAAVVPEEMVTTYPEKYPELDVLGGSENVLLAYNFKVENPSVGRTNTEQYLPYVGYYDIEGNLKDTFFDSFLYLPCMTVCPSGGTLYYNSESPAVLSDWLAYEEDTFAEGYNIGALNEAVGQVKSELGLNDYKAYVYYSLFPTVYGADFGDVDGDGVNEDLTDINDRKKIAKWWIDRFIARFESGGFGNLKLNGFYWYDEAIHTNDPHMLELLDYTAEYIHSLGYYFIWIPYYCASGYSNWASYGFDIANMQPNYMFSDDVPFSRVYDNAALTKKLGMAVEIEIDGNALLDDYHREKYRAYLRAGVETGYMNTVKMYYQDAGPGCFYNAYKSEDPQNRSIYDDTYLYAKRKLAADSLPADKLDFSFTKGQECEFKLTSDGVALDVSLGLACRYGSVKIGDDGTVTYIPMEGFVGSDSFTLVGGSNIFPDEYTVTVTVE